MRLLHSQTLKLQEFFGDAIPRYAILSHTWGTEEVTCQDISGRGAKKMAGYAKIRKCCDQAARDGIHFVWIDTCCIEKSSSAELSEAINSMYSWYKNSAICYAYLSDLPPDCSMDLSPSLSPEPSLQKMTFGASRWFTRGWTLQELIAPATVVFYAQDWTQIGSKEELSHILSQITGIDEPTLKGRDVKEVSVARRMSWASKRVTTRVEDIAYCLVGLFGVNLPLLYGEGEEAYIRLQEEIMKSSDDQSLFAWEDQSVVHDPPCGPGPQIRFSSEDYERDEILVESGSTFSPRARPLRGFLARSPAEFENAGNVVPYRNWDVSTPYAMTNQGLRMQLSVSQDQNYDDFIGILACHFEDNFLGPLGVYIRPIASVGGDQFARDGLHSRPVIVLPEHVSKAVLRTIYIRQDVLLPSARDFNRRGHFLIRTLPDRSCSLLNVYPHEHWNGSQKIIRSPDGIGALWFRAGQDSAKNKSITFLVIIRSGISREDFEKQPSCSCQIIVNPTISKTNTLEMIVQNTPPGTLQTVREDLSLLYSQYRDTVFARIGREVFLGQAMFVVDIVVMSQRLHKVPFFVTHGT